MASRLAKWIRAHGMTPTEFSRRCDPPVSQPVMSRILRGVKRPTYAVMAAIWRGTGGEIGDRLGDYHIPPNVPEVPETRDILQVGGDDL